MSSVEFRIESFTVPRYLYECLQERKNSARVNPPYTFVISKVIPLRLLVGDYLKNEEYI